VSYVQKQKGEGSIILTEQRSGLTLHLLPRTLNLFVVQLSRSYH